GEPILESKSPELLATLDLIDASLAEAVAFERMATSRNPAAAQIARERINALEDQKKNMQERVDRLIVRAPHDGYIVGQDPGKVVGSFLKEGEEICTLADVSTLQVNAAMTQTEVAWLQELTPKDYDVQLRLVSDIDTVFE